jgi:hypothetical protein
VVSTRHAARPFLNLIKGPLFRSIQRPFSGGLAHARTPLHTPAAFRKRNDIHTKPATLTPMAGVPPPLRGA